MSDILFFSRAKHELGYLVNMNSRYPVTFNRIEFHSSEHLYQSLRFTTLQDWLFINSCKNPMLAKQRAYQIINKTRLDWDEIKVRVMYLTICLKVIQHSELQEKLIATYPAILAEYSEKDHFWGCVNGNGKLIGKNALGNLWMVVRKNLMEGTLIFDEIETNLKFTIERTN